MCPASATLEGGDGVQCDNLSKCSTRFLRRAPASPEEANALHKRASGVDELNCLNKAGGCKRSEEGTFLNGWGDHLGFPGQTSSAFQFLAAWSAKDAYIGGRGVYMEYTWTTWSIHGMPNVHTSGERSMHGVYMDYMEYTWQG